jgi:hypothetical protein
MLQASQGQRTAIDPGRLVGDPMDWQLLGSNEGGATWTTVDTRTGETFGKRLEKRTFALKDSPTYKAYRFKFTKVKDSSNQGELKKVDFAGWQADGRDTVGSSFNATPAK